MNTIDVLDARSELSDQHYLVEEDAVVSTM